MTYSERWQFSLCPLFLHADDNALPDTAVCCTTLWLHALRFAKALIFKSVLFPEDPELPTQVSSETPGNGCLDGSVSHANTWQVLISSDRV